MIQEELDFDLVYKLLQHVFHLLLRDLLQSHEHTSRLVNSGEDLSESTLPLAFAYLEIVDGEFVVPGGSGRRRRRRDMCVHDVVVAPRGLHRLMLLQVQSIYRLSLVGSVIACRLLDFWPDRNWIVLD
jgi:hypothetical protein